MSLTRMLTLAAAAALTLSACSSTKYYMVKDPESNKEYFTKEVKHKDGSVTFKDAASNSSVTLQNSQVLEITKDQYTAKQVPK